MHERVIEGKLTNKILNHVTDLNSAACCEHCHIEGALFNTVYSSQQRGEHVLNKHPFGGVCGHATCCYHSHGNTLSYLNTDEIGLPRTPNNKPARLGSDAHTAGALR